MGGTSLPTASTAGYGTITRNSRTFVACDCLRAWLPVVERLGILRGLIKSNIDIVQLTGKAAASAGVHAKGGAFDVKQRSDAWIALFREAGAPATWRREGGEWEGNEHAHGALSGCPHNGPVAYQITAQSRGYNGLGQAKTGPYAGQWGYGGRDPHPAPKTRRTWREGIAWAEAEIAKLERPAPITPTPEEDPLAGITVQQIVEAVWLYPIKNRVTGKSWSARSYVEGGAIAATDAKRDAAKALATSTATLAAVKGLADSQGQNGDALVAAVTAQVAEALKSIDVEVTLSTSSTS